MHPGKVVTRYDFSRLFNKAWMRSMTVRNVVAGFKVTGIYPVNHDVFAHLSASPLLKRVGWHSYLFIAQLYDKMMMRKDSLKSKTRANPVQTLFSYSPPKAQL